MSSCRLGCECAVLLARSPRANDKSGGDFYIGQTFLRVISPQSKSLLEQHSTAGHGSAQRVQSTKISIAIRLFEQAMILRLRFFFGFVVAPMTIIAYSGYKRRAVRILVALKYKRLC